MEEFFVAAPNTINPKKRSGFVTRWGGHADQRLLALEHAALHDAHSAVAA
ncbi:hypothetical protein LTT66_32045 [Nocardia gipuzkoensis]|nr:hypothetical protein [Nocardia gipuzkoensis]UGT67775.1 hypothetical protein LTT66_32045 [Nocardia gipuzkoensis]